MNRYRSHVASSSSWSRDDPRQPCCTAPPESPQFPEALNKLAVETAEFKTPEASRPHHVGSLVRVSRTRYDMVDKKRAASVRTDRRRRKWIPSRVQLSKERQTAHLVFLAHARACVCLHDLLRGIVERNQPRRHRNHSIPRVDQTIFATASLFFSCHFFFFASMAMTAV